MSEPVKLSRERWNLLRLGKQWPAVFDPSPEPLSIIITEPLSVGTAAASITFLPAEYVPGDVLTAWRPGNAPNADGSRSQYHAMPCPK